MQTVLRSSLSVIFSFLALQVLAQLSGTYTINPSGSGSTNYKSFKEAIDSLNSNGVRNAVTFNVADGSYNEQVSLLNVSGATETKRVSFVGSDSSKVILSFNCSQYDAVVKFNAASHFTFKGMTVKSTNSSNGYGFHITSGSEDIEILNCRIDVPTGIGTSAESIPVNIAGQTNATNGQNGEKVKIHNSVLRGGYYGVNIRGTNSSLLTKHFDIENCKFYSQYYMAIRANYADSLAISSCTIDSLDLYYGRGIYIQDSRRSIITSNKIYPSRFGIYLFRDNFYNRSDSSLIINNEISDFGDANYQAGIYSNFSYNLRIYHNTILTNSSVSSTTYSAISLRAPNNHTVLNNNIVNTGNTFAFVLGNGTLGNTDIDYNNFYSRFGGLVSWQGTTYNSLSDLQTAVSGQNQNSINSDPSFGASRDLLPLSPDLNNRAKKGVVNKDLRDTTRPKSPDNIPDIGAYEYYVDPTDIDIIAIPEPITATKGNNDISIAIKNNGSADFDDSLFVRYRIGQGSWVADTAVYSKLAIGAVDTFTFSQAWNVSSDGTYDVCATISPMLQGDPDSLVGDTICVSKCVGRKGFFSIDPSGNGDYRNFSDAIASLNCGIAGTITFVAEPGTYNEKLDLSAVTGAGANSRITFRGKSRDGVIINYTGTSSKPATILFDGASYINFKNLTIKNNSNSVGTGVWFKEKSQFNSIDSCNIILDSTAFSSTLIGIVAANSVSGSVFTIAGNESSDLNITNNLIVGGGYGIRANGTGGRSTSPNFLIDNNLLRKQRNDGMSLAYIGKSHITRNEIKELRSTAGIALRMYYCNTDTVANNILQGGRYGLYMYYENTFNRNSFSSVYNNMMSNLQDPNYQVGAYVSLCYNITFYHNSIWTKGSISSPFYSSLVLYYSQNCFVKNNSIKSDNGGYIYAQYYGSISINSVDYNNYFGNGLAKYFHDGISYTDLSSWQSVKSNFNKNSIEGDPNYNSITDLHASGSQLNNKGVGNIGISKDIDGQARPFSPDKNVDIGADEYYVSPYDLDFVQIDSPFVPVIGQNKVIITLRNAGYRALNGDTAVVSYSVDNTTLQTDTIVISSLKPDESMEYEFNSPWTVSSGKTYLFCAKLDTFFKPDPDSLLTQEECKSVCPGISGNYTIDASGNGDFKTFRAALNALDCGLNGPVTFNVKNGNYNERIIINEIQGANSKNHITFTGESTSGTIISYTGARDSISVLHLFGADYVSFEKLTIQNQGTTWSRGVRLSHQADYNKFTDVVFDIPDNANFGNAMSVYISDQGYSTIGNSGNYNVFTNCLIQGGYYGVRVDGISTSSLVYGNTFKNCHFKNHRFYSFYGLYAGQTTIEDCDFDSMRVDYRQVFLNRCSETQFNRNTIKTGSVGVYPYLENYYFDDKISSFSNNMISGLDGTTVYGMDFYYNYNCSVNHNSFSVDNGTNGAVVRFRLGNGHDFRNNSLSKSSDIEVFENDRSAFTNLDYNNYYKGSSSNFALYNGSAYGSLSQWKSGVSGFNQNSKEGDPNYISSSNLRVDPTTTQLSNWGTTGTNISTDIDGDIRNPLNPDVGADEYSSNFDLSVTQLEEPASACDLDANETITVWIKNDGGLNMASGELLPYAYQINSSSAVVDTVVLSQNLNSGDSLKLSFGKTADLSSAGSYVLKVWSDLPNDTIRTNDTLSTIIQSFEIPAADFSFNGDCTSEDISFSDNTTIGSSSISRYLWNFGNGTSSTAANPKTSYSGNGSYSVKLLVETAQGCKDSITKSIAIGTKPTASFTASELCLSDSTNFTNTSTNKSDIGSSFSWDFDDGNNSVKTSPKNKYASAGSYSVQLISSSANGCSDTATTRIDVSPAPNSDFALNDACLGDATTFTNNSSTPTGYTSSSSWSFGDGNTSTATSPSYTYGSVGNYTVSLTTTLNNGCDDTESKAINVTAKPNPKFSFANSCLNDTVDFTNQSTIQLDTIKSFAWTFGDGGSSTLENPKKPYSSSGTYTVKLVLTSNNGCKDSTSQNISIYEKPSASFSAGNKCEGESISFTNNSSINSGSISAYDWKFGDGFTSTSNAPTYTYSSAGSYTVQLIASSNNGCLDTATQNITVYPNPNIAFSVSNICLGDKLEPTNNSNISSGSLSYNWDFDDGNTSTSTSPSHTYTSKGTFSVKLVGTSNNACKDSLSKSVVVDNVIVPGFSASNVCIGDSTIFNNSTNTSCGTISAYNWDFGDGNSSTLANPEHKYTSAGSYSVKLVVTQSGGAKDSITKTVEVYAAPSTAFSTTNACAGVSTNFTNSSSISTGSISAYEWSFGDGFKSSASAPSHTYANGGNYTVSLISTSNNGCKDTSNKGITIYELPKADFNTANVCDGAQVSFNNQSSIGSGTLSYSWEFGDGFSSTQTNPTYTYGGSGSYTVKLTAESNNGCEASISKSLTINPKPTASFSVNDTCSNVALDFKNNSTISSGTISYAWTFGDGNSSTSINPSHKYSAPGSYSVKLVLTSNNGCKDSVTKSVNAFAAPNADFVLPASCSGTQLTFNNASNISSGSLNYNWDFGDGNTSTNTSPRHNYSSTGNYQVKLVATSNQGCKDSVTKTAQVYDLPTADFTSTGQCLNDSINFTNGSSIASGTLSYSWNFGDGNSSTQESPKNKYAGSGAYDVKLVTRSSFGCKDSITKTIDVYDSPTVDFSSNNSCNGEENSFSNNSTINTGTLSHFWDFDDGSASTLSSPTHRYTSVGTYNVKLTSTSNRGCADSLTKTVEIFEVPVSNFSPANTCLNDSVLFQNQSSISSGNLTYVWDFDDGNSSVDRNPEYKYQTAGSYDVALISTSANNCRDTITKTVHINPNPEASYSLANGCKSESFSINNMSTISSGTYSNFWRLGDGSTSTQKSISHTYNSAGTYFVSLILTSDSGCVDSLVKSIVINEKPQAAFTASNICEGDSINFTNNSSISSGSIQQYRWTLGDGTTSNQSSPNHLYSSAGTYSVRLITISDSLCTDTSNASVTVYSTPNADFSASNVCFGDSLKPTNNSTIGTGSINNYTWKFGDDSTSALASPAHYYQNMGTYSITLIAESDQGCIDSTKQTVVVDNKIVADFSASATCNGENTIFTNKTNTSCGQIASYQWIFGDGNTSSQSSPTHKYSNAGDYNVSLIVQQTGGNADTATQTITVNPLPQVNFSRVEGCSNDSVQFSNNSTISNGSIVSYLWRFGDGNTSKLNSPKHIYGSSGEFDVKLIATSSQGCTDSATVLKNEISPAPKASFNYVNACVYDSLTFTNTSQLSTGNYTSLWSFGDGDSTRTQNTKHLYSNSGSYDVELLVNTNKGCKDSIMQKVSAHAKPVASHLVDSVCLGKATTFSNQSSIMNGNISSYSYSFGDGFSSNSPNTSHSYSSAGSYTTRLIIESDSGCLDTSSAVALIYDSPQAAFNASNVCLGDDLSPTNNSTIGSGSISTWLWSLGDGNTSSQKSPTHNYNSNGTYTIKLIVTSTNGCTDSSSQSVVVSNTLVAGFTANDVCLGDTVFFSNTTNTSCGTIGSYQWDFDDGSASTQKNPFRVYSSAGTYSVELKVRHSGGSTSSIQKNITVHPKPNANLFANAGCEDSQIQFNNFTNIASGSIRGYEWQFGDGDKSKDTRPSHTYDTAGVYTVALIALSNEGCTDTATQQLTIHPKPDVNFVADNECFGNSVDFNNRSSISNGSMSYNWDFGNGFSSTQRNPSYNYSSVNSYNVELTVTSNQFCSSSLSKTVRVFALPEAIFSAADTCSSANVRFSNNSSISSGLVSYEWSFGNGDSSLSSVPSYSFANSGQYEIELMAISEKGCRDSSSSQLEIFASPFADFSYSANCPSEPVTFSNSSTASAAIDLYQWSFSDGTKMSTQNTSHAFNDFGPYSAQLRIRDDNGCQDSIEKSIVFEPVPIASFSFNAGCERDSLLFRNNTIISDGTLNYEWNFGDGTTSTNSEPLHAFNDTSSYQISLVATSDNGCTDTLTQNFKPLPKPEVSFTVDGLCLGDSTRFINGSSSENELTYFWQFGEGTNVSSRANPAFLYSSEGTYDVTLLAADQFCADTTTRRIEISDGPDNLDFDFNNACARSTVQFNNLTAQNNLRYRWIFFDGTFSSQESPSKFYPVAGEYTVGFEAFDGACGDSTYKKIEIYPFADSSYTFTSVGNRTISFNPNDTNLYSYSWEFGDGESSADYAPTHQYDSDGTYTVKLTVVTTNGCTNVSEREIEVKGTSIQYASKKQVELNVYPNPFKDLITTEFTLENNARVTISVYNQLGQEVKTILNNDMSKGTYQIPVNFTDVQDQSGVYYLKVNVDDQSYTHKLIRLK